ncbi:MAG: heat-inducible transcriptional repressor HrcA [Myxococcales bacterium]|nr:heat-inducible transcriptional repressor HrcA [Myxococcales bacterium]
MGNRAKKVLHAVVTEYLGSGEAVGSKTITRRYNFDVSPATVRSVMGELEELGLLRHPHASAGRVPTERGLRYYVDSLLRVRGLSGAEKEGIQNHFVGASDVGDVVERARDVLREMSHLTVVVQAPRIDSDTISHLEFVKLREDQLLAVIATSAGNVQNKAVQIDFSLESGELERINNYLRELVAGRTLAEIRARVAAELEDERTRHDQVKARALGLASVAVPEHHRASLIVDGQSNILSVAESVDGARTLLRALEEKEFILKLLDRTLQAPGICVFIGAEANLADLTDVSVVTAPYGEENRPVGTIGVIGPSRINYAKVISLVDFTADVITKALPKL